MNSQLLIIPPTITAATIRQSRTVPVRPVVAICTIPGAADQSIEGNKMVADHSEEKLEMVRPGKVEMKG